ncbi:PREDICTED: persephin [Chrysochloris asiatica]|uniref:Persephin n=1 Tax=Chrysochloris asiatica TaxID=185453 RepID=A0A9B0TWK8_CHRAS|nr:PREDICTED: persephin [Chrysochloris asiatica]
MAPGGVLLSYMLSLWLLLDLCGGPAALGSPVVEFGKFLAGQVAEAEGTQRPWLGTRIRRAAASPCQLRSLTLPVAELGLGYVSEERVVFRYCAGSCPHGAHTQHGLTLARLRSQGHVHGGPCCRPTRYTDVVFLDDRNHWQRLVQLSAAACGCSD